MRADEQAKLEQLSREIEMAMAHYSWNKFIEEVLLSMFPEPEVMQ